MQSNVPQVWHPKFQNPGKIEDIKAAVWRTVVVVVALAAALLAVERSVAQPVQVGCIEYFNMLPSDYAIVRKGVDNPEIYPWAAVYAGDQIFVKSKNPNALIRIRLTDGTTEAFFSGSKGLPLDKPSKSPSRINGGIKWEILEKIGRWLFYQSHEKNAIDAGSRQGESDLLTVGVLDHSNHVVEGTRKFTLSWRGGKPPFMVTLYRIGKLQTELEKRGLTERQLPPQEVSLTKGDDYVVEVHDAGKSDPVAREFKVVSKSELPNLNKVALLTKIQKVAWLASQDEGRWALESYLQLGELIAQPGNNKELAPILRDMLANGALPGH